MESDTFYSTGADSQGRQQWQAVSPANPMPVTVSTVLTSANWVRGSSTQATVAATTVIAAPAAGSRLYINAMQIGNSGTTTNVVTLNDTVTSQFVNPANSGSNIVFPVPLVIAAATALIATPSVTTANTVINAQGYFGP
jgi:hypothetical protein